MNKNAEQVKQQEPVMEIHKALNLIRADVQEVADEIEVPMAAIRRSRELIDHLKLAKLHRQYQACVDFKTQVALSLQ